MYFTKQLEINLIIKVCLVPKLFIKKLQIKEELSFSFKSHHINPILITLNDMFYWSLNESDLGLG